MRTLSARRIGRRADFPGNTVPMSWRRYLPVRPRLGIRATVVLPLLCGTLVVALLGMHWIEQTERDQRSRFLRTQAWTIASSLASIGGEAGAPSEQQRSLLTHLAASFAAEPGVSFVAVLHGSPPIVIASNRRELVDRPISSAPGVLASPAAIAETITGGRATYARSPGEAELIELTMPFQRARAEDGAIRGAVLVQIDGQTLKSAQAVRTKQLCLGLLAAIVLLSSGTYVLLRQTILRPIEAISQFAERIARGDRTARISIARHDELGHLARQIDVMVHELARREERERLAGAEAQAARDRTESTLAELASLKYALDQHAIISVVDRNGFFTHTNNKFCEMSGYRRDQLAGRTHRLLDACPPDQSPWEEIWKVISREVWRGEMCCKRADDGIFWVDNTVVPFRNADGKITQYVVMGTDITPRKRAEQEMANERALLSTFVEHAPAAIAMFDTEMRYLAVSRRWVTDYALEGKEIIGRTHYEVFPKLPARWRDIHTRCLAGETIVEAEDVWRPEGWERDQHLHWEVRPWRQASGEIGGLLMFTEDLTVQKRTEAALRESKEQFELALRGSNDGIWDWNIMSSDVFFSRRFEELLGYREGEFPHRFETLQGALHPEDSQMTMDALQRHLDDGSPFDVVCRLRTSSEAWRWFRFRGEAVRNDDGRARRMAGSLSDITSLKQVEEQLLRSARMDQLTGLPNRSLFLDRLQQQMLRGRRAGHHNYAVMFLDFDRFKIVNDSLGHDAGDTLLMEIAGRLREQIRSIDSISCSATGHTTARLGGDEFVVLLTDLRDPDDARVVAERLMTNLSRPYQIGKHEVYSTASIGIVVGSANYLRPEEIVRDADTAMYEAKRNGKSRYVIFDASMHDRVRRRMKLETDLHRAIAENQLFLVYQPIFKLSTRELQSVEALVRWRHPEEGLISPGEFIPIAEESALILSIGEWVLREACRKFAEWRKMLGVWAPPSVSINVSRKQFAMGRLPDLIQSTIEQFGLEPSGVNLEVTEDFFASDVKSAIRSMKALKALGVTLAIDDFGTGSSSFASLHQFPADVLKIDRSLISEVPQSEDAIAMIQGLTTIARNLEVKIVAEGIETEEQAVKLLELGCDFAQGFYFAKPLHADQIVAMQVKLAGPQEPTTLVHAPIVSS